MNKLGDDRLWVCATRRGRSAAAPVRVAGPLLAGGAFALAATVVAVLAGLSALAVLGVAAAAGAGAVVCARRTFGSLFAGAVLALVRPFSRGERVRIYLPELHGVVDAEIVRIGPANTTMATPAGMVVVSNAQILRGGPAQESEFDLSASTTS